MGAPKDLPRERHIARASALAREGRFAVALQELELALGRGGIEPATLDVLAQIGEELRRAVRSGADTPSVTQFESGEARERSSPPNGEAQERSDDIDAAFAWPPPPDVVSRVVFLNEPGAPLIAARETVDAGRCPEVRPPAQPDAAEPVASTLTAMTRSAVRARERGANDQLPASDDNDFVWPPPDDELATPEIIALADDVREERRSNSVEPRVYSPLMIMPVDKIRMPIRQPETVPALARPSAERPRPVSERPLMVPPTETARRTFSRAWLVAAAACIVVAVAFGLWTARSATQGGTSVTAPRSTPQVATRDRDDKPNVPVANGPISAPSEVPSPSPERRPEPGQSETTALLNQARAQYEKGDRIAALEFAQNGLQLRPNDPKLIEFVDTLLEDAQRSTLEARELAARAVPEPRSSASYQEAQRLESEGRRQLSNGRKEQAIQLFSSAAEIYSRSVLAAAVTAESSRSSVPREPLPSKPATARAPTVKPAPLPTAEKSHPSFAPSTAATAVRGTSLVEHEVTDIQQTLGQYKSAYEGLSATAAKKAWPSVDEAALAKAFAGLRSQRLVFETCEVVLAGPTATASCQGRTSYIPKIGPHNARTEPRRWNFSLRKIDAAWKIERAEAHR